MPTMAGEESPLRLSGGKAGTKEHLCVSKKKASWLPEDLPERGTRVISSALPNLEISDNFHSTSEPTILEVAPDRPADTAAKASKSDGRVHRQHSRSFSTSDRPFISGTQGKPCFSSFSDIHGIANEQRKKHESTESRTLPSSVPNLDVPVDKRSKRLSFFRRSKKRNSNTESSLSDFMDTLCGRFCIQGHVEAKRRKGKTKSCYAMITHDGLLLQFPSLEHGEPSKLLYLPNCFVSSLTCNNGEEMQIEITPKVSGGLYGTRSLTFRGKLNWMQKWLTEIKRFNDVAAMGDVEASDDSEVLSCPEAAVAASVSPGERGRRSASVSPSHTPRGGSQCRALRGTSKGRQQLLPQTVDSLTPRGQSSGEDDHDQLVSQLETQHRQNQWLSNKLGRTQEDLINTKDELELLRKQLHQIQQRQKKEGEKNRSGTSSTKKKRTRTTSRLENKFNPLEGTQPSDVKIIERLSISDVQAPVFECNINGWSCAMKELIMPADATPLDIDELHLLESLQHPNVCKYLGHQIHDKRVRIFMTKYSSTLQWSITTHLDNGTRFTASQIIHIMLQILRGLLYLHKNGICHRDLKSDNIFCILDEEDNVCSAAVGDLGASVKFKWSGRGRTVIGTPGYAAPEILNSQDANDETEPYGLEVDVWSVGMIFFELMSLQRPYFHLQSVRDIAHNVTCGILPSFDSATKEMLASPTCDHRFLALVEVMKGCLRINPKERLSLMEIRESLFDLVDS